MLSYFRMAFRLGWGFSAARIFKKRVPLFVSWNLTYRCTLRCKYCAAPDLDYPELETKAILKNMDDFYALGMRWAAFTGGEPLLRKDLPEIIDHAKALGIATFINTNGTLVPKCIEIIKRVERVTISLDGLEEAHDAVRGAGAFQKALEAVRICNREKAPVALVCTLSSHNLNDIEALLDLAKKHQSTCLFQPATEWLDPSYEANPVAPPVEAYRAAIGRLMTLKKQGAPVANSMAGLRHLALWPTPTTVQSTAAGLTCTVDPDGNVTPDYLTEPGMHKNDRLEGMSAAEKYLAMEIPRKTAYLWCGPLVELNLIFALHPGAIWNAIWMQS